MTIPVDPGVATQVRRRLDALEEAMRESNEVHRLLLECVANKREAIRRADIEAISALVEVEHRHVERLRVAETQRKAAVAEIGDVVAPPDGPTPTLQALVALAPGEQHERLEALAAQLRDASERLRHESSVVRAASEALSRHLAGVMQSMQSALSRAGVYGRRGGLATGGAVQSSLDVRT